MAISVSVHYVDKVTFLKGNADIHRQEVVMLFECSHNYVGVVENVRIGLNLIDISDVHSS